MEIIYKIIYNPSINYIIRNIAKLFNLIFPNAIRIPVSGKIKINYKKISLSLNTNQTSYVSNELFYNKPEQYEFTPLFIELISQSEVFFDVGANIGYFSILGEIINPELKTFAFEPSVGPLNYLQKNIKENCLKNVNIIDKAVSDIDGKLEFFDVINSKYPWIEYNLNGSNSLQNKFGAEKSSSYPVEVIKMESIVSQFNLNKIDLIKLDTECTEHLILQSSIDVINKYHPIIICEVYDVIENEIQECINKMTNYFIYQYLELDHKLIRIEKLIDVTKDHANRNFIFCPKEKTNLLEKFTFQL